MSQDTPAPRAATQSPDHEDAYLVESETFAVAEPSLLARLGAEIFGSFVLVLAILGVTVYGFLNAGTGGLVTALAGGFAFLGAAAAVGHVSGGHFNPAVTLGAAIAGRTSWADLLPYWIAQILGAALAGLVMLATVPTDLPGLLSEEGRSADLFVTASNGFGQYSPLSTASQGQVDFGMWQVFLIEVVVTAVFVGIILGVTDRRANRRVAPVAMGLALTVGLFVALPIDNGSLNPARSLAAALFANDGDLWKQQWVFVVAPLVGAAVAALFYRAFATAPAEDDLLGGRALVEVDQFEEVPVPGETAVAPGAAAEFVTPGETVQTQVPAEAEAADQATALPTSPDPEAPRGAEREESGDGTDEPRA